MDFGLLQYTLSSSFSGGLLTQRCRIDDLPSFMPCTCRPQSSGAGRPHQLFSARWLLGAQRSSEQESSLILIVITYCFIALLIVLYLYVII